MIPLFNKLEKEKLLKERGSLLDLGSGNGRLSEPFFKQGYEVTLVDKDSRILEQAEQNLKKIKEEGFQIINAQIENFESEQSYDGIIMSNILPFQKSKESVAKILNDSWNKLNSGGFLYFTLFGIKDPWATEHADTMIFYENKDEILKILPTSPYYLSEDYGNGPTMKGDIKTWHIFTLLYLK